MHLDADVTESGEDSPAWTVMEENVEISASKNLWPQSQNNQQS